MDHIRIVILMMLSCLWTGSIIAQEDFDPSNPPDPSPAYRVSVTCNNAEYGYVSGRGLYHQGSYAEINTSARDPEYVFLHWLKDGELYSYDTYIGYTVEACDVEFQAVYEYVPFDPSSPDDPMAAARTHRLYLVANPDDACSFSMTNGEKVEDGQWLNLTAYANPGFEFVGWYENNAILSKSLSFNYETPGTNTTLTAVFLFNPANPGDPGSVGIQGERGDINNDGDVNATDASVLVKKYLDGDDSADVYDVNRDGVVNITDATTILNIYLNEN